MDLTEKDYVVIVQCDIVKQRCSGYSCERAFNDRKGGFADYPPDRALRTVNMTCGGCCGRALHRNLAHLVRKLDKAEGIKRDRIVVQLSTCITKASNHGPACPHLNYLRELISSLGLDYLEDTYVSTQAAERRASGRYPS